MKLASSKYLVISTLLLFFCINIFYHNEKFLLVLNNIDINLNWFTTVISSRSENKFFFNLISLAIPYLLISIVEFQQINGDLIKKFLNISLLKMNKSEGFKFADIFYFIFNLFSPKILLLAKFSSLGLVIFNQKYNDFFHNIFQNIIFLNQFKGGLLIFILIVLLADFSKYIGHRIFHKVPFLWEQHEFHHSSTQMVILNSVRFTVLEKPIESFLTIPFLTIETLILTESINNNYIFPLTFYIIYETFSFTNNYFGHSSKLLIYPKPLSYIFMSPSLHWLHHSTNQDHYDKNFGMIFSFWDRLFGTYMDESNIKNINGYGIHNTIYNRYNPFYTYYILPIRLFLKRIINITTA